MSSGSSTNRPAKLAAALDLGTCRTTCWIAERTETGARILALGEAQSEGIQMGEVRDVKGAAASILSAIEEAEAQSGLEVQSLCASLAGIAVKGVPGRAAIPITREGQEIMRDDARRAVEMAGSHALPAGATKLHVLPQSFAVDRADSIMDPVGLTGSILESEVVVISGSTFASENISRAVRMAGRRLESIVAAPAASGIAALTQEERELGALTIDIGAGLTGYSAWKDGELHACGCVPVGGDAVTSDIAKGLGLSLRVAEEVKCQEAVAYANDLDEKTSSEVIKVRGVSGSEVSFTRGELAEIAEARIEEAVLLIKLRLGGEHPMRDFGAGVVISGGGAHLTGIEDEVARVMHAHARKASANMTADLPPGFSGPENVLGVGLIDWALRGAPRNTANSDRRGGFWFKKVFNWLATGF